MFALEANLLRCDGALEHRLRAAGYARVAGLDEAGRGCLFGPVFAAAVVLPPGHGIEGIRDSKTLTAQQRERLARLIRERAAGWAVAEAAPEEIDRLNILRASRLAMQRALQRLSPAPDYVIVDAVRLEIDLEQLVLEKGDATVETVAAASILAKAGRDACMAAWDAVYPGYGFRRHKGYATREHLDALARMGVTPHHRLTFAPVRRWMPAAAARLAREASGT